MNTSLSSPVLAMTHIIADIVPKGVKSLKESGRSGRRRSEDAETPTET